MATDIEIFVGTSQDFLLSFKVKKTSKDEFVLERFIAHRCHNGQIICMDTCGRYLATGGGDDRIVIIDLKLNRDVHEIVRHEGSINSLSFTNKGSDLLSASEDGRLVATAVGSWKPVNTWKKPHTGKAVTNVCLHASDKFALTLGKDGTLRGWDMFKGTQIKTFNTKDLSLANITLDNLVLCPNGNTFAISGDKTVSVISLMHDEPYDELTLKSRATSMCWLDDENLLIGMENGSIEWTNINKSEHVNLPNIHPRRIKGMHYLNGFLGTISSSGSVSLWSVTNQKLTLICSIIDDSMRPTCIKMIDSTENRYKEAADVPTAPLKENQTLSDKKSRPISTTGKVIVEADVNEHQLNKVQSTITPDKKKNKRNNPEANIKIEMEANTDIATPPERKSNRKRKTVAPKELPTVTPPTRSTKRTKQQKQMTPEQAPQKPIVVRSPNSDDDFEPRLPQKKPKITNGVVAKLERLEKQSNKRNSSAKKGSPNISIVSEGTATQTNEHTNKRKSILKKLSPNTSIDSGRTPIQTNEPINKRKSILKKLSPNTTIDSGRTPIQTNEPINKRKSILKKVSPNTSIDSGRTPIQTNEPINKRKSILKKVSPNTSIDSGRPSAAKSNEQKNKRKSNAKKESPNTSIDSGGRVSNKRKSDATIASPNISIVSDKKNRKKFKLSSTPLSGGGTSITNKETQASTPLSRPAIIQENGNRNSEKSLKKRRFSKLDLNTTEPSHLMATRNKRRYTYTM